MANICHEPASQDFAIHVKTGDRRNAETDSKVRLIIEDEYGNKSEPILLLSFSRNDFESGVLDTFLAPLAKVSALRQAADIVKIELWKENFLPNDWFVDTIRVENRTYGKSYMFPLFRWVTGERRYHIKLYDTSFPQEDEFSTQRARELKKKRKEYEIDQHIVNGPVTVKSLPKDEEFSFSYKWDLASLIAKIKVAVTINSLQKEEFTSISDIYGMFDGQVLDLPETADRWNDDVYFGIQRLASVNHSVIRLVTEIPEKLPVTDKLLKTLLEDLTIQEAIDQKKLFMVDLEILEGIQHKDGFVVCAPIALFYLNSENKLLPVAIQLNQKPCAGNPIFTPKSPTFTWALAKMWFNNADTCYHQSLTHLGLTHLLMEGFCLATHRNISLSHPIFKLLAPHFLYLIAINSKGLTALLNEGGFGDQVMNSGHRGMLDLIRRRFDSWRLTVEGTLPEELKTRGLDDPNVLPTYYFRNDAILLYDAIFKYVTSYVNLYYTNTELLITDPEIQNWAKELVKPRNKSKGGMGFQGIPGDGEITSNDQLIQILTCIIYTSSVAHAATNFPQYEEYSFPPKYPAMMKGKPPTNANAVIKEDDLVKYLANPKEMITVMSIMKILSSKSTKNLGNFEVQYIYEPKALKIVDQFRNDLDRISRIITERDCKREEPYFYLIPYNVPNSISI